MYSRQLKPAIEKSKKSILLLGPRQCGKSTLIASCRPEMSINLSRESEFLDFSSNPRELEERLDKSRPKTVFIDEVQRLPGLLNTVQAILDERPKPIKFYLTGSSARKLRRGQANLLPGRVSVYNLGPLFWGEMTGQPLSQLLSTGTLPGVLNEDSAREREKTLRDYAGTYLKEEIQAEALARDIEGFSRFLKVATTAATEFIDMSKLASQAQVKRLTANRYLEILEDTLIFERVPAFAKSERRRLIQHPKIFFFDVGVYNGLIGNFTASADRIGALFEHFIYNQISSAAKAYDIDLRISSYRTEHHAEIDFIVEIKNHVYALELKASKNVGISDLRGFTSFQEFYGKKFTSLVLTTGTSSKIIQGVEVLPWQKGLERVFSEV